MDRTRRRASHVISPRFRATRSGSSEARATDSAPNERINGAETRRAPVICEPDYSKLSLPWVTRRASRLHGWGVFAAQPIAKNTRILPYTGEKITHRESLNRERRYLRTGFIWCFRLNRRWVVDGAVGGGNARFVNHSCRPNCYTQIVDGIIWIRAARNIASGEELTYNYYTEGSGEIPCRCRPGCENLL
jgi:uncharacterized protein